jgi:hypothetical protein
MIAVKRHVNRFIDILINESYLKNYNKKDVKQFKIRFENFPERNSYFNKLLEHEDILIAYNYKKSPDEICRIIDYILDKIKEIKGVYTEVCAFLEQTIEKLDAEEEKKILQNNKNDKEEQFVPKWNYVEIKHSNVKEGIIYILSNELMPGICKIGFTAGDPHRRAADISREYGLPRPFAVETYIRTKDPYIVEGKIHFELEAYKKGKELFNIDVDKAEEVIRKHVINTDG